MRQMLLLLYEETMEMFDYVSSGNDRFKDPTSISSLPLQQARLQIKTLLYPSTAE